MANTLMIYWPRYASFEVGEELTLLRGEFTGWSNVTAGCMQRADESPIMELSDEEFEQLVARETRVRPLLTPHSAYTFPIRGLVLTCRHTNTSTLLNLFVTNQNPKDHHWAMTAQILGAVPGYWVDAEMQRMWNEHYVPDHSQQMEIVKRRPITDSTEALDARWAASRLYATRHCLDYPRFAQYTGYAEQKLSYSERHRNRLEYLRTVRLCVFDRHAQPDYLSPLLTETVHETLLTVESLVLTSVSALDLLARAVDHLLRITVSPAQRTSRVTFAGLLRGKDADDPSDAPANTGPLLPTHLPLTKLWLEAWDDWIAQLVKVRNSVTHNSCLLGTEVSHGGVAFQVSMPEPGETLEITWDAYEYAQDVCGRLRALFRNTFILIRDMANQKLELVSEEPPYPTNLLIQSWSPETSELHEALALWIELGMGRTDAATEFYHRLHPDLRREWPITACTRFLEQHPLRSYSISIGAGGTDRKYGFVNQSCVALDFDDRRVDCWFSTARVQGRSDRWHIIRETISTFPDTEARVACSDLWRRQSGKETGHRDVECGCILSNVTDHELRDVTVTLFAGNKVQELVELAVTAVGTIGPGEQTDVTVRHEGGCLPPFGIRTLNGPATVRVCYTLPDCQRFAADYPFPDTPPSRRL